MAVFLLEATPGERILRSALSHFDRILAQTDFQTMMQQEMMRMHQGESKVMPVLMQRVFSPVIAMFQQLVHDGAASGELIQAGWMQIHLAVIGSNVFYFMSSNIWRSILPNDPFDPVVLRERREGIVRFLGQAIFTDRQHGANLAERVLADTPMPSPAAGEAFRRQNERA